MRHYVYANGRRVGVWLTRQVEVNRVGIVALAGVLGIFLGMIVYVGLTAEKDATTSRDELQREQKKLQAAVKRLNALERPTPQSLRLLLERLVDGATPARRRAAARELARVVQRLSEVDRAERQRTSPPLSPDRQLGVPRAPLRPNGPQGFIHPPRAPASPPTAPQATPQPQGRPPAQPDRPSQLVPTPDPVPRLPLVPDLVDGLNGQVCPLAPQLCR